MNKNIRIYRDGVWVDFSTLNGHFFISGGATRPFANASFFNGGDWCIPRTRAQTWDLLFGQLNNISLTNLPAGGSITRTFEKTFDGSLELLTNSSPSVVRVLNITDNTIEFQKLSTNNWNAYLEFSTNNPYTGLLYVNIFSGSIYDLGLT